MIRLRDLPPELRELTVKEQRQERSAAKAFFDAVASGDDPDALEAAMIRLNETINGWRRAMRSIKGLPKPSQDVRLRFLWFWVQAANLPRSIRNRRTLVNGLRVLLPGGYQGPALRVYRGTTWRERRARRYGVSWTTELATAQDFARGHSSRRPAFDAANPAWDGIVLKTEVTTEAVIHVRGGELILGDAAGNRTFDENEVIVDPFKLGRVSMIDRKKHEAPVADEIVASD